jgi:Uma2 family endonuclease
MTTITRSDRNPLPLGDLPEESPLTPPPVPDDSFYEVVDGQIVELPPMGVYETRIATLLALALGAVVEPRKLGRVVVETMFWLNRSGKLKRRPDLAFVSAEKWPLTRKLPRAEAWDIVPDLAIEIVSETNSAWGVASKVVDFFTAGVRQVWVVYPELRQVYIHADRHSAQIITAPDVLDGGELIPGFRLPLSELFEDEPGAEDGTPPATD